MNQLARIQWALKLPPPLSEDTESFCRPLPSTMTILVGPKVPIADPFALALLKLTVPKLASGRMPPLAVQQGASAMTSAEEFAAPLSDLRRCGGSHGGTADATPLLPWPQSVTENVRSAW